MQYKIPIDDLFKYSFKFSLFLSLTAFVAIYVMDGNVQLVLFRTTMTFFQFYGCFLINIFLYMQMQKGRMRFDERYKVVWGILWAICYTSLMTYLSQELIRIGWLPAHLNDLRFKTLYHSWKIYLFVPFLATVIFMTAHFFHSFVILANITRQSELELVRLQTANMESTIQLLKQQIQPHFLFNALNTLKSLIKKQPDVAENYLIQLSDFLRTSISSQRLDKVKLREELLLCDTYMEMQKTRFGAALFYAVDVDDHVRNKYVIPLFSLQPLLENAIKHNESTKANPLTITIEQEGDYVVVRNNLRLKKYVEASTGNGLSNLGERYRILFGEEIVVDQTETEFKVKLKLMPLENSSN